MKHLSALDALFLHLETAETPMHVGSLMLLDVPARSRESAYANIRKHIASRLHLAPLFTRRLQFMPFDLANPIWLEAEDIDLAWHIQRTTLPKPGTRAQLEMKVAKLHEGLLDRARPLWQFTIIDGLQSGQVAVYAKLHHAGMDGQGGVALAQAVLDIDATPRKVAPRAGKADQPLDTSTAKLIGAALSNTVAQYSRIVRAVPDAVKAASAAAAAMAMSRTLSADMGLKADTKPGIDPKKLSAGVKKQGLPLGPRTPLNVAISAKRIFATVSIPLDESKSVAKHFAVKLNDVVLATVSGALRRAFAADEALRAKSMIGAVPASLRAPGDTTQNNQVTMMLVDLASKEKDPLKRLAAIHRSSGKAKLLTGSMKSVIPTDLPSLGLPWLMGALSSLYNTSLVANRIPVIANLVISNVPGPPMPLYLAGYRIAEYFPVSIVTHGLGLNVTILSYNGSLEYGLVADPACTGALSKWTTHIKAAHAELLALCAPVETVARRKPRASRISRTPRKKKS
ncbi:MAG: wax ester/triacylglycerol synthase family O-acyltransferase [Betaproteobacteria bacterium]|nr:wax ester/triacylglycerol synthase family O-acyltransferase [Betaproteobacteria bacterium]